MKKYKRRQFVTNGFCWATALATVGWLSQKPDSDDCDKKEDVPDIPVQPCYGVAPIPETPPPPKKD